LGVGLEHPAIRFLRRLGGGEDRRNRPVGRAILLRGLHRLLDLLVTQALLADARQAGSHPRSPPSSASLLTIPHYVRISELA
ncbi:unnamed protein product, partial [Phaeothamnion confervicola]